MAKYTCVFLALVLISMDRPEARQPSMTNGRIGTHVVTTALDRAVQALSARQTEPMWIGYAVSARSGEHQMCCWNGDGSGDCCAGCRLEPGSSSAVRLVRPSPGAIVLERGDSFFVLYRIDQGQINRIRMFSEDCPLDLGGRTLHWLTSVDEDESVALLTTFIVAGSPNRIVDSALSALAMHRSRAALDRLLTAARKGATSHVRGQALFWLAHRAGEQAIGAITDAIANDPETDVKRRAVFALSQLPNRDGVPLLIQVARTNANPAVRKQAMFWLGQSRDPRALQFFQEVLFK
jgi:hypothetical protein